MASNGCVPWSTVMFDRPAQLPDGWRWSRLGQVVRRIDLKVNPGDYPSEPFSVVEARDLSGWGTLSADVIPRLGVEVAGSRRRFEPGDILYSRLRPESGRVRVADIAGLCSMDIWVLRVAEPTLRDFIAHYLRSRPVREYSAQISVGGNVCRINYDAFKNIPVPLPPLAEQAHIVEVLRTAADVRAQQRTLGLKMWEVLPSILGRIVPVLARSQWRALGSLGVLAVGRIAKDGDSLAPERPVILSGDLQLGHIMGQGLERIRLSPELEAHGTVQVNDLLLPVTTSIKQAPRRIGLVDQALASSGAVMGAHLIRIRLTDSNVSAAYLLAWLLSPAGERALLRASSQHKGRTRLTVEALSCIEVPVPSLDEQRAFAEWTTEMIAVLDHIRSAGDAHDEAFDALSTYAMLGEVSSAWRRSHAGAAPMLPVEGPPAEIPDEPALDSTGGPLRLAAHLSPFQQRVAARRADQGQPLVPDDRERFDAFCLRCTSDDSPAASNHVLRVLHQLAGLGLVARIAFPNAQGNYLTAFRPLRKSDLSREQDLKRLITVGESQ